MNEAGSMTLEAQALADENLYGLKSVHVREVGTIEHGGSASNTQGGFEKYSANSRSKRKSPQNSVRTTNSQLTNNLISQKRGSVGVLEDIEEDYEQFERHLGTEGSGNNEDLYQAVLRNISKSPDLMAAHKTLIKEVQYKEIVLKRKGQKSTIGGSIKEEPLLTNSG